MTYSIATGGRRFQIIAIGLDDADATKIRKRSAARGLVEGRDYRLN